MLADDDGFSTDQMRSLLSMDHDMQDPDRQLIFFTQAAKLNESAMIEYGLKKAALGDSVFNSN